MENLKKERTKEKSAVTRLQSKLKRFTEERNQEEVIRCIEELKGKYRDFEKIHDTIHAQVEEAEEIEASDNYLIEVQDKYSMSLKEANIWIDSLVKKEGAHDESVVLKEEKAMSQEMLAMFNLPKVELDTFSGDPLNYHSFIAVFDESVDKVVREGSAKLTRLLQYTSGDAKQAIQPCAIVGGETGYQLARKILLEKFGNDLLISEKFITTLKYGKYIKSASDLQILSNDLVNCSFILSRMNRVEEINSQHFIASIVDRLQPFQKNKWRKTAMDMKRDKHRYPDFHYLVDFVKHEAQIATDPVYGEGGLLHFPRTQGSGNSNSLSSKPSYQQQAKFENQQLSRPVSTSFANTGRTITPCLSCGQEHRLYMCYAFKALKPEQKLKMITDNNLCENCLLDNHQVENCFRNSMCGINGCSQKHSRFIHLCKVNKVISADGNQCNLDKVNGYTNLNATVCIPVVQVKVNNVCDSSAMLDTCSTSTFCTERLAKTIGLKGVPIKYELTTLNSKAQCRESRLIPNLCIESKSTGEIMNLKNVYIVDDIPVKCVTIDVVKYEYLRDLPVQKAVQEVELLIGQDNSEALIPLDVRKGKVDQPFAVKTILGWSLHGHTSNHMDYCGLICTNRVSQKVVNNFIMSNECCKNCENIDEKVERLWKIEDECLGSDSSYVSMSEDDKEMLEFWDRNVKNVDGHYELPIPWKPNIVVPDNFELARSRLMSLQRSLHRRGIYARYEDEIQKLLDKGYAEKVSDCDIQGEKTWYLPHHAVINAKKPEKLRVVYDSFD
jgi:hypothetical protein